MNTQRYRAVILSVASCLAGSAAMASDDAGPGEGMEVLARGPVHEAYAQPLNLTLQPGPIVPKRPPEPIPEIPAEQKPRGENIQWIPGYWAWDGGMNDFVWVSGFWRAPPPKRKWAPGHWNPVGEGWQWTPGFWMAIGQDEIKYQDPPPESQEAGPSVPAPDEDSIYIPGCWIWRDGRYWWRPGGWQEARAGWVWIPAHYSWSADGWVFIDGYWDYPLEDRGLLFAPVCFTDALWTTPGWRYQPCYAVNVAGLCSALFVRPSYCSYYFGDYYDVGYLNAGFRPWCLNYGPRFWDPLFSYYNWRYRGSASWSAGLATIFRGRYRGDLPRPAVLASHQNELLRSVNANHNVRALINTTNIVSNIKDTNAALVHMVTPVNRIDQIRGKEIGLTKLSSSQVSAFQEASSKRQIGAAAARSGTSGRAAGRPPSASEPTVSGVMPNVRDRVLENQHPSLPARSAEWSGSPRETRPSTAQPRTLPAPRPSAPAPSFSRPSFPSNGGGRGFGGGGSGGRGGGRR